MVKRIGVHLGTAGGPSNAVERAREVGSNTFQIFSSSPRMWRAPKVDPIQAERMCTLRAVHDVSPLVIHASYLVNVCLVEPA
jgi:deoxyribonuclease-4